MNRGILIFILVATLCISRSAGLTCGDCSRSTCEKDETALDCPYGTGKSVCGCCAVCLKGPGEECGGPWALFGNCGSGLACLNREGNPVQFQEDGTCEQNAIIFPN